MFWPIFAKIIFRYDFIVPLSILLNHHDLYWLYYQTHINFTWNTIHYLHITKKIMTTFTLKLQKKYMNAINYLKNESQFNQANLYKRNMEKLINNKKVYFFQQQAKWNYRWANKNANLMSLRWKGTLTNVLA